MKRSQRSQMATRASKRLKKLPPTLLNEPSLAETVQKERLAETDGRADDGKKMVVTADCPGWRHDVLESIHDLTGIPDEWHNDVLEAINIFSRQSKYVSDENRKWGFGEKTLVSAEFIRPTDAQMGAFQNEIKKHALPTSKLIVTLHGTSQACAKAIAQDGFNTTSIWSASTPVISGFYSFVRSGADSKEFCAIACKTLVTSKDEMRFDWQSQYPGLSHAFFYQVNSPSRCIPFLLIKFAVHKLKPTE